MAGLLAGCEAEESSVLPEVSWASEYFEFATHDDDPLCGGTLLFQQRFVDLAQEMFGEPVGGQKFIYYTLNLRVFEELLGNIGGAYFQGRIFTKSVPDLHEVTHAVVDLSIGQSHPFSNEGIAEVFRERYPSYRYPHGTVEDGIALDGADGKLPTDLYGRAGHFISYGLDVHGVDATVALLTSARPGDPPESLRASIALAFGMSYEEVLADYAEYPLCPQSEFRWPITECDVGSRIPAVNGGWFFDMEVDCSKETVIGPRVSEFWSVYTLDVPEGGDYVVTVFGEEGDFGRVSVNHCSPGCAPDRDLEVQIRKSEVVTLRGGRYQLTTIAGHVESGHLQARIDPVGPGP